MDTFLQEIAGIWGFSSLRLLEDLPVKGGRRVFHIQAGGRYADACEEYMVKAVPDGIPPVEAAARSLLFLEKAGERLSPRLIPAADGRPYAEIGGLAVYIMTYICGRRMTDSPGDEYALGQAARRLHNLSGCTHASSFSLEENLTAMKRRFAGYPFKEAYDRLLTSLPDFSALKQGFVHTDIGPHNAILDKNGRVVFIDMDDAGTGCPYVDAGYPLITQFISHDADSLTFQREKALAFYGGYQSSRPLSPQEAVHLFQGSLFMQLAYMPCYGEEGILPMWNIAAFAVAHRQELIETVLAARQYNS